jgi:hypothetical protein
VPLNAGILIIGSLLWDLEEGRPTWRNARLDIDSAQAVTAPIRYGRLSGKKRGHTYTMVFSRLCELGLAKVVRCSHTVSSAADLVAEAEHLWKAEQPSAEAGRIAADWGCVALLCNPERKIPEDLLKGWANHVGGERNYGQQVSQTREEGRLVGDDGLLRIAWPRLVEGAPVELDILLATTNDPTLRGTRESYPSVETIADAWNAADSKHAEYFWKNIDNGIRTFQDDEILVRLRPRRARRSYDLR